MRQVSIAGFVVRILAVVVVFVLACIFGNIIVAVIAIVVATIAVVLLGEFPVPSKDVKSNRYY